MRTPVTLKIKFKSANLDQFIERYSVDVSRGGIFIRTKEPLAVGTQLKFEFQLQDASSLIAGEGTVVWIREHDPARSGVAPGMGVRFDKLLPASQQVLDRILAEKGKRGEAQMESRFDAGVRASASASGTVSTPTKTPPKPAKIVQHNDFGGGDSKQHTPLPAPAPGLDAAGDEFGEESTRVMQDAVVQALADKTREEHAAAPGAAAAAAAAASVAAAAGFGELSDSTTRASADEVERQLVRAAAQKAATREATVEVADQAPRPPITRSEMRTEVAKGPMAHEEPGAPGAAPVEATEPVRQPAAPPPQRSSPVMWIGAAAAVLLIGGGYFVLKGNDQPVTGTGVPTTPPKMMVHPATTAPPPTTPTAPTTPTTAANDPTPTTPTTATPPTKPPTPAAPEKPAGISVAVTSDPPGAQVTVDGKPLPDPTPTELTGLDAAKSYDVKVGLKGFHEWKTKVVKPKAGDKLAAQLVANEKLVEVSSTPLGADVMLDGKKVGKTPFTIHKLDVSKQHELEVKHAGFVPQSRVLASTDSYESKGDKDVLAVAMKLDPEPKAEPPRTASRKPGRRTPGEKTPETTAPTATPTEKPPEATPTSTATEKPPEATPTEKPPEKAPAEKPPEEKPEKPADKPAADKPAEGEKGIKVPSWMKDKPADDKPAENQ